MNLKRAIIIISTSIFILSYNFSCQRKIVLADLKEGKTYNLWHSVHLSGTRQSDESDEEQYYEEDILQIEGYNLICALPVQVKTIIAAYTQFRTFLFKEETEQVLAEALGGFKTLDQAQKTLLVSLKNEIPDSAPYQLSFRRSGNFIYFKHSGAFGHHEVVDKFQINNDGTVEYIPPPLKYVPYDRTKLNEDDDCKYMKYKLNGEEVAYAWSLFLDPNNIESVAVNKRENTINITQKDPDTEYFSLSMIDLDSLNTRLNLKVKSIDEISFIYVRDEYNESHEYHREGTKIELSCVKTIGAGQNENDPEYKWLIIKLKDD